MSLIECYRCSEEDFYQMIIILIENSWMKLRSNKQVTPLPPKQNTYNLFTIVTHSKHKFTLFKLIKIHTNWFVVIKFVTHDKLFFFSNSQRNRILKNRSFRFKKQVNRCTYGNTYAVTDFIAWYVFGPLGEGEELQLYNIYKYMYKYQHDNPHFTFCQI